MIWTILIWVLLAVLAALVALICLPVTVWLSWRSDPNMLELRTSLLGGIVPRFRLFKTSLASTPDEQVAPEPKKSDPTQSRTKKRKKRRFHPPVGRMIAEIPALITGTLGRFKILHLNADAEFGLGDPAATGQVFGLLTPVMYGFGPFSRFQFRLKPDFSTRRFQGNADTAIRVIPITLAFPAIRFGWRVFVVPGR